MPQVNPSDHPVPIHLTLVEQAADCVRRGILGNRWLGVIPSEGELCRELGVSRGTLRRSLAVLFDEGILSPGGRGGRHAIVNSGGKRKRGGISPTLNGSLIRVLSPQPRFIIAGLTQILFQTMGESLGRRGLHLEFEHHAGLWRLSKPDSVLRKITAQPNTAGWLLYRSPEAIQKWFASSGIPAVVLGSIFPEVELSHAEFDLVAASRHAAGVFAARGHRNMVYITVEKATPGDRASAAAFTAAVAAAGGHAETIVFDDTIPGLCRALDSVLLSKPVPTAYFVGFPNHAPATIGHLTRCGYPVPKSAAVISRMDARLLAESIPTVARYEMDAERLGRNLARLMLRALNPSSRSIVSQSILMPEFVDGETAGGKAAF